jgi:hypothetical protein
VGRPNRARMKCEMLNMKEDIPVVEVATGEIAR